jgi:hypothetical protein
MTQTNFNWFLHVMLFYYTQQVLAKQTNKGTTEVNEPENDPEYEDIDDDPEYENIDIDESS